MDAPRSRTLRFGLFEVDLRAAELKKRGVRVNLQEQPFQILASLLEHPGELLTREQLRHKLWSADTFVDFDRNLNKAINKLRLALGDSAENPRFIETLPRRGYRFIAPVSAADDGVASPSMHPSAPDQPARLRSGDLPFRRRSSDRVSPRHPSRRTVLAAVVLVTTVGLGAFLYLRFHSTSVFGGVSGPVAPRRSVAVLGFRNLSGRADQAWLSTALSDWLTTELSAGEQLRTVPAENVARARIELGLADLDSLGHDNLIRIGKNLSTDWVVAGSYASLGQDSDGQVRLDLRLEDARSGETTAGISETGSEARLFDLVSRAGERLRAKLRVAAVTQEEALGVAQALPTDPLAERFYSEGLTKLRVSDALAARDLLQQSVDREPAFAMSHSALSRAWLMLGYDREAKREAKKAYDLSLNLPRAERLEVEARYHETSGEWDKAIDIYRALFAFFPDSLDYGLALAQVQLAAAKAAESSQTVESLRKLPSPLGNDPRIELADADAAEFLGDFSRDEASSRVAAEKAQALGASLLLAQALANQSWALANLGRFDEASEAAQEVKQLYTAAGSKRGVGSALSLLGIVEQNRGDPAGAKTMYEQSLALARDTGNELAVANEFDDLGDVLFALGDLAGSREHYEQALTSFRRLGHEDGVALATGALAHVLLVTGDHESAKKTAEESLELSERIGDRTKAAIALDALALVYRAEGDVAKARDYESQAVSLFNAIGSRGASQRAQLGLADLFLDTGRVSDAAAIATEAAAEFRREKAARDEAWAEGVMAEALWKQGRLQEAEAAVEKASMLLKTNRDRELELLVEITSGQIRASTAPASSREVLSLQRALVDARKAGFVNYELEARLANAQIDIAFKNCKTGEIELQALEKDASNFGFGLIAHKAAAARNEAQRCSSQSDSLALRTPM